MGDQSTPSDPPILEGDHSITEVFDVHDSEPYEERRTVRHYLSQETRQNILQVLLGHPSHCASITELTYYIPRSRSAIREQLDGLSEREIVAQYYHEPNAHTRDLPANFWGFTEFGVALLHEFRYLRGLPVMRAVHDSTRKSETVIRHQNAPRPTLPETVRDALTYDEPEAPTDGKDDEIAPRPYERTRYADVAPADTSVLNSETDGDRTLDELQFPREADDGTPQDE